MTVLHEIAEIRRVVADARHAGKRVGCVPTMGALHEGHRSLIRACREQCDLVVVWIFVNPTQFGPHEDLAKYPRPKDEDLAACSAEGVDVVYMPPAEALYPSGFGTWVVVEGLTDVLEGACRPGHFRGVTTIVMKLLQIIQPDVAFFGAKDYQQQAIVRKMVRELDVPVDIEVCPTVRENDGLAMSSRNRYLSADERQSALSLSQALQLAHERLQAGETNVESVQEEMLALLRSTEAVVPEYAVIADPDTLAELKSPQPSMVALVAAMVGTTRLIDNRQIDLANTKA